MKRSTHPQQQPSKNYRTIGQLAREWQMMYQEALKKAEKDGWTRTNFVDDSGAYYWSPPGN